ncbi:MAG: hypothetical protein JO117_06530 [Verrucomicrobia bacterium]|nr:hypothetical protein [Verrucomicrobiota bacterium]MBV9658150.1 hypothetical protein [Verrucomicrobiota bacterium]
MPDDSHLPIFEQLAAALRRRLEIIRDRAAYARDADAHLRALQAASEQIVALQAQLPARALDPQFAHYLQRCSYDKALVWLEEYLAAAAPRI